MERKKKRERERKIAIDSQKRYKFWLLRIREKQVRQVSRKICFFLAKLVLSILMLISRKPVQRRGIDEK